MCGITGFISESPMRGEELERIAARMSAQIAHRGPDDYGTWSDPSAGVALGFRRLSIIDLSDAGHQPMSSEARRYTMIFNGEVYNYRELAKLLSREGAHFRGHSDTEVILAAFERWGIVDAVRRFVGMFAIAVWDAASRQLSLIRDRLGIKPVYYYQRAGLFSFGSELKALAAGPEFDRSLDEAALEEYLRYLYVPAPRTIYRHARKLLPGQILTIRSAAGETRLEAYWSAEETYKAGLANRFEGPDAEAIDELSSLLADAVRLRMRADVPMGALLSGGIDSTTTVALMQAEAARPTRTFSIGFPGTVHDESAHAAAVAQALGTDHTELSVGPEEALGVVPLLPAMFDEPLADPSQIPTYLVSKLARQFVTVAVTGDGGDELFGGYERYLRGEPLLDSLLRIPRVFRQMAASGISSLNGEALERIYRGASSLVGRRETHRLVGQKVGKLGQLLRYDSSGEMYRSLLSACQQPRDYLTGPGGSPGRVEELLSSVRGRPMLDQMMLVDQQSYLTDDLLTKVDRASMAVGLEARVPILDHRVVEFSWRLPRRLKVRDGRGKWILRQVLYRHVNQALVDRPKTGFSVPIADWLRGPLRGWGDDLLLTLAGPESQFFRMDAIRRAWNEFQSGRSESALGLWAILMFMAWERHWRA
jgi:asparagine synthase (glutamine-hydrolysing)